MRKGKGILERLSCFFGFHSWTEFPRGCDIIRKCKKCLREEHTGRENHEFSNPIFMNDWPCLLAVTCQKCRAARYYESHVFHYWSNPSNPCEEFGTCNRCGTSTKRTRPHSWNDWKTVGFDFLVRECGVCHEAQVLRLFPFTFV